MGIYNELMEHQRPPAPAAPAPRRLLPDRRSGQAQGISPWPPTRPSAGSRQQLARARCARRRASGVQLELAKNIVAQLPEIDERGRTRGGHQADHRHARARSSAYSSPFKAEALELLKKYKPSRARNAAEDRQAELRGRVSQGEQAIASPRMGPRDRPAQAGDPPGRGRQDIDKANLARYNLAFCLLHEQAVLRGRGPGRAPGPPLPAGASRPRPPRSAWPRWPTPITPTPRSTAAPT